MKEEKKKLIEYTAVFVGILLIFLSYILAYKSQGKLAPITSSLLILGVFVSFIVYALIEHYEYIKLKKAEEFFPTFLRDYAEAINSGMNFNQAFDLVLKNDYGALNEYLKKAKYRLSLNIPFPKVMEMLQHDLRKSPTIKNALGIIINSYYSGGDVAVTMMDLSETVLSLWNIAEEKKSVLSQQIIVMYSIFVIFIIIVIVLYYVFKPIASIETGEVGNDDFSISIQTTNYCDAKLYPPIHKLCTVGYIFGYSMDDALTYFRLLLFFTAIIEAASIGLMIGVIQDNRVKAGLKHSAILVTITLLVFALAM